MTGQLEGVPDFACALGRRLGDLAESMHRGLSEEPDYASWMERWIKQDPDARLLPLRAALESSDELLERSASLLEAWGLELE